MNATCSRKRRALKLWDRAVSGCKRSLASLYKSLTPRVNKALERCLREKLIDQPTAEDATQSAWTLLIEHPPHSPNLGIESHVFTVARDVARKALTEAEKKERFLTSTAEPAGIDRERAKKRRW